MRKTFFFVLLALCCLQTTHTAAQAADTTRYFVYSYMKVKPGMHDDYLKMEKAYKKLHLAFKKAGHLQDWSLAELLSPSGTSNEYDFVCRNSYVGAAQFAGHMDGSTYSGIDWKSLLNAAEMALFNRTDEIRDLVKTEVWTVNGAATAWADDADKTAKIAVFNYFTIPAGKTTDDHTKVEMDIWRPIMKSRVKDGTMKGWFLLDMRMPFGADVPYEQATVDLYTDMKQYMMPWFEASFKKVHPGKNQADLLKQTSAVCTLQKGEVRMIVDRLDWPDIIVK